MSHPPWLRFQCYFMGLPKTGSTSVATVFGNYRSGHEVGMDQVMPAALARIRGELDDAGFLAATGSRIARPALELDSATCHHLYPELLVARYPRARFVLGVRDVRSWATSALDMVLRKRLARRHLGLSYNDWELGYLRLLTAVPALPDDSDADDSCYLPGLIDYWAAHLHRMRAVLPADRTLVLPTDQIGDRLDELAGLVGVAQRTLRADLAHTNRAPLRLDRFTAFDSAPLRAAYQQHAAGLMAEMFPAQHAQWQAHCAAHPEPGTQPGSAWPGHTAAMSDWARAAVAESGIAATR